MYSEIFINDDYEDKYHTFDTELLYVAVIDVYVINYTNIKFA